MSGGYSWWCSWAEFIRTGFTTGRKKWCGGTLYGQQNILLYENAYNLMNRKWFLLIIRRQRFLIMSAKGKGDQCQISIYAMRYPRIRKLSITCLARTCGAHSRAIRHHHNVTGKTMHRNTDTQAACRLLESAGEGGSSSACFEKGEGRKGTWDDSPSVQSPAIAASKPVSPVIRKQTPVTESRMAMNWSMISTSLVTEDGYYNLSEKESPRLQWLG